MPKPRFVAASCHRSRCASDAGVDSCLVLRFSAAASTRFCCFSSCCANFWRWRSSSSACFAARFAAFASSRSSRFASASAW